MYAIKQVMHRFDLISVMYDRAFALRWLDKALNCLIRR